MQTRIKHVLTLLAVLLLALMTVASPAMAQAEGQALVRFVHAIPGAAAIDIYANDTLAFAGLESGNATAFLTVPGGDYSLRVTQAGVETVLWEQDVTLAPGSAQTLIAATTQPLTFQVFQDDLAPLPIGKARFTAIHAIPAGPAIDVILSDGRPVVAALNFGQVYGTLDVPALAYEFAVVPTGEGVDAAIVPTATYPLSSGTSYSLLVYGTAQRPQAMLLGASTQPESAAAGYLRIVHAVPGAPAVDVAVDGTLVAPALAYGSAATDFMSLAPGDYQVSFREAGTENELTTADVTVGENQYVSVIAYPADEGVVAQSFVTDVSTVNQSESVFNIINLLGEGATTFLSLNNGTPLSGDVPAGQASAAIVEPADAGATVSVMDGGETIDLALQLRTIYGGVYYDVLVVPAADGPEAILLEPVSLAQTVGSAPGAAVVAVAPTEEIVAEVPTEASSEVVAAEPTGAPDAVTEAAPEAGQPTATALPPTAIPPTATPAPTQGPPVARVLLDPGANLQMRQYPSSQAFSLGLAPSGATLTVVGRQGAQEALPFETPTAEATEWVDPATLLAEGVDLPRLDTWLFVSYETAEGGQIDAWVNAYYVAVNASNGNILSLRGLPTVPSNRAGEAFNTVVGVPTVEEVLPQAIVGGLDEGVNLQIRRTPDVAGESLTLVPNGTSLNLLGMNEERSWAFVRYETEDGAVTGWANALFLVEYTDQGETLTFADLESRNLIETVDDAERGTEAGEVAAPAAPTRDPMIDAVVGDVLLDEGANLQLRRNPDAQAESLALIPAGEQVVITGRTEDGAWLYTSYDEREGWVNSAFVGLTLNGRTYSREGLPVTSDPATATPTLDPNATVVPTPAPTEVPDTAEIVVDVVGMTFEPGGSGEGLPILVRGRLVYFLYTNPDGQFSFIQLMEDGTTGWVPSYALLIR